MLGSNDLKKMFHCSAYNIANGVCEYIKVINSPYTWEKFYVPKLLIISPVLLKREIIEKEGVYGEFDENSLIQSEHLAQAIESACKVYSIDFLNAADYAEASMVDGLHMDEENHQKLANAIYRKINSMDNW